MWHWINPGVSIFSKICSPTWGIPKFTILSISLELRIQSDAEKGRYRSMQAGWTELPECTILSSQFSFVWLKVMFRISYITSSLSFLEGPSWCDDWIKQLICSIPIIVIVHHIRLDSSVQQHEWIYDGKPPWRRRAMGANTSDWAFLYLNMACFSTSTCLSHLYKKDNRIRSMHSQQAATLFASNKKGHVFKQITTRPNWMAKIKIPQWRV